MSPARCVTRRAKRSSATLHILRASIADAALNAGIIMSVTPISPSDMCRSACLQPSITAARAKLQQMSKTNIEGWRLKQRAGQASRRWLCKGRMLTMWVLGGGSCRRRRRGTAVGRRRCRRRRFRPRTTEIMGHEQAMSFVLRGWGMKRMGSVRAGCPCI